MITERMPGTNWKKYKLYGFNVCNIMLTMITECMPGTSWKSISCMAGTDAIDFFLPNLQFSRLCMPYTNNHICLCLCTATCNYMHLISFPCCFHCFGDNHC